MTIKFENKPENLDVINKMIEKYKTGQYTYKALEREFGINEIKVKRTLTAFGIGKLHDHRKLHRRYTLNENYFDVINTEEKAYWLGFLYADGYNSLEDCSVTLSLQIDDREIIERLQSAIGTNSPIKILKSKKDNEKDTARLYICSKYLSLRLQELGVFDKKSLILEFPTEQQCPRCLLRHFIRGFYDGNGGCGYYEHHLVANITSTMMFCEKLYSFLEDELNVSMSIARPNSGFTPIIRTVNFNSSYAFKFLDWLYQDTDLYLIRKKNKYENAKLEHMSRPRQQIFNKSGELALI